MLDLHQAKRTCCRTHVFYCYMFIISSMAIAFNLDISQHLAIYVSTITFLNFFSTAVHDIHLLNVMFSQLAPCPKVRPSLSLIFEQNVTYYGFIKIRIRFAASNLGLCYFSLSTNVVNPSISEY